MKAYRELLHSTSRTFAVGIEALPEPLREAVTLAYLVLRVSDYYEDSPTLSNGDKRDCLERWARLIEEDESEADPETLALLLERIAPEDRFLPDYRAAREAGFILEGVAALPGALRSPIRTHTVATTRGMARWAVRGDDFPDEAALDDYMYEVAGRVGLLLTDLFSAYSPGVAARRSQLFEVAVSFGLGLQTVNVIRGLHEDPERGWTFIPRHLLREDGACDPGQLREEDRRAVLGFLVRKAGRHIADAITYCQLVPRRERGIRIFCIIPALLALQTARLSAGNLRVFSEPVKVPRGEVRRTVVRSRLFFFLDRWLDRERSAALGLAASESDG